MSNVILTPELARWISPLSTAVTLTKNNQKPYLPAKHLRYISSRIARAVYSGHGRIIVCCPPRHGKSETISKFTSLWHLERWPEKIVMCCGYGKQFAQEFGRLVRNIVNEHSDELSFSLSNDSQKQEWWHTNKGGAMICAGVGSGITGKGSSLTLIDDPIKGWEEASSWTAREAVWNWYLSEARTRLSPGGSIIVVATRWNEDDLIGRLIAQSKARPNADQWEVIMMPAIYDDKAALAGPCPLGRQIGDVLWPEMYPLSELQALRSNEIVFESLYQQRPGTVANLGNVYSNFDATRNVKKHVEYDPRLTFFWSLDFNVDPMCSVYGQYSRLQGMRSALTGHGTGQTRVLGELCMADTDTLEMCQAFVPRFREICRGDNPVLEIYGDASGESRHTSQTSGTDYDIIKTYLKKENIKFRMCVQAKNPPVKDRINAVNDACFEDSGMQISESCKMLIRDLDNVRWKRDLNGNTTGVLDKSQKDLTHISDAFGYFVWRRFGSRQGFGASTDIPY
jgi:hypothetical protein